jgi:hypothetical protein
MQLQIRTFEQQVSSATIWRLFSPEDRRNRSFEHERARNRKIATSEARQTQFEALLICPALPVPKFQLRPSLELWKVSNETNQLQS